MNLDQDRDSNVKNHDHSWTVDGAVPFLGFSHSLCSFELRHFALVCDMGLSIEALE